MSEDAVVREPTVADTAIAAETMNRGEDGVPTVIFLGTSLTAGYGLSPEQAYPALVEAKSRRAGLPIRVVNAGVSGETSAGALRRIDWVLKQPADVIVIETGANDALRALSVAAARSNIEQIVARVKKTRPRMRIVLVEMLAPPNFGPAYTEPFRRMYSEIAKGEGVTLVPFFLDGVAGHPEMNQADGVHPNAAGSRIIAENVWAGIEPVVREVVDGRD